MAERFNLSTDWRHYQKIINNKKIYYRKTLDIYSGQNEIQQAINIKIIGFKNDTASESAYIEALVPMAIYQLRTHQNDPTLCQVMAKPLSSQNHHLEAQQIAFMQVGNKYCSRYYDKRSSWGDLISNTPYQRNSHYMSLHYSTYFNRYVKPRIANALQYFKNHKEEMCGYEDFNSGTRNPIKDARRQAYLLKRKEYCVGQYKQDPYYHTGRMCLIVKTFMDTPYKADFVEQCKETPGVLFKY